MQKTEKWVSVTCLAKICEAPYSTVYNILQSSSLQEKIHYRLNDNGKKLLRPQYALALCKPILDERLAQSKRKSPQINSSTSKKTWRDVPWHKIDDLTLNNLKTDKIEFSQTRNDAIVQLSSALSLNWNETLLWLDHHYCGWRGYEVKYVDGRVG